MVICLTKAKIENKGAYATKSSLVDSYFTTKHL